MLKKTAIALGLAMITGSAFAAGHATNGVDIGVDSQMPINMQFDMLDTNDNGVISRAEAQASPELSKLYGTFDTSATIEDEARKPGHPQGITLAQFKAGIQAMGSGVVGPAASGGATYIVLQDGTRIKKKNWEEYQRTHNNMYHDATHAGPSQRHY